MSTKQKLYLSLGLILIIAVLLLWGIVKPLVLEIKNTSTSVKEENEKLFILTGTDQTYLKQLEEDYKEVKDNIALIKSGLISSDQAVDFFMALEGIAFSTSNDLEIEAKDFPVLTLYLVGNFSNFMKFLGWLENGEYFVDVDSIWVREDSRSLSLEETEIVLVNSILKLKAYEK